MAEAFGKSVGFNRRTLLTSAATGAAAVHLSAGAQEPISAARSRLISIVDYGARADGTDNKTAIEKAVKAAIADGRTVEVPQGTYNYSTLDFGVNDATKPVRLLLIGPGTLRSTFPGTSIVASKGSFYDFVIDGVRFESIPGAGTTLIDGDAFRRLIFSPGTQIEGFDWVLRADDYLQSVRMLGAIVRGGHGAVVMAPRAYDCTFAHNIIEFVTDGIVIDGEGDPAAHTCRVLHNVIEGIGGRAIVLGSSLATSICGNYLENNMGGDILLNAGSAPHKGLRVQDNSIQMSPTRMAGGGYGIVWGRSTALPVRAGGNFCTGPLHDTREVTAIIDMSGDFSQTELYTGHGQGAAPGRSAVGRAIYTDGLSQHITWFDRYLSLDPYAGEIRFGGKHQSRVAEADEPPVLTHGAASPQASPGNYERKNWARGSVVFNVEPLNGQPFGWICTEAGTPGEWAVAGIAS